MRHCFSLSVLGCSLAAALMISAPVQAADNSTKPAAAAPKPTGAVPKPAAVADEKAVKTTTSPSGVIVKEIRTGTGKQPTASDQVTVHYRGNLDTGGEFDSSYAKGPVNFQLSKVIKCWTEGVATMKVGGKAILVCPAETAYGAKSPSAKVPPNSRLTFTVELLGIGPVSTKP